MAFMTCAVRSCSNSSKRTSSRIKYFRFPIEDDIRSLWVIKCDRNDSWNPSASFVCSSHFTTYDYEMVAPGVHRLRHDAVPSRNLRVFDWNFCDQTGAGTGTDDPFSDEDDPMIDSIMKAGKKKLMHRQKEAEAVDSHFLSLESLQMHRPTTSFNFCESLEAIDEKGEGEPRTRKKRKTRIKRAKTTSTEPTVRNAIRKKAYCSVPTCVALKGAGCHYLPRDPVARRKWLHAIFHDNGAAVNRRRRQSFVCRRHFVEDDYLDPPKSGMPRRLRYGVIPTMNLPLCRAEVLLAEKTLKLDAKRKKPEEKHLPFCERLVRENDLMTLYHQYIEEIRQIDPALVNTIPTIRRRGELKGAGEPCPMSEEAKERVRKENEIIEARKQALLLRKQQVQERKEYYRRLKTEDPESFSKIIAKEKEEDRRKKTIEKIIQKTEKGDLTFSDDIELVAQDPIKNRRYKIVLRKAINSSEGETSSSVVPDNWKTKAQIVKKVLSRVDVTKRKRIKFTEADELTKKARCVRNKSVAIQHTEPSKAVTAEIFEPTNDEDSTEHEETIANNDGDSPSDAFDHTEDVKSFQEFDEDLSCNSKASHSQREVETDPFEELQRKLRSLPESEARVLVREAMEGYKETFKKNVTQIRQLIQMKRKTDRQHQMIARVLSASLRDQYIKYYCQPGTLSKSN